MTWTIKRSRYLSTLSITHPDPPSQVAIQKSKYLLPLYGRPPLVFTHGKGCYLYDDKGRKYLDMNAGIAVNALGHQHPQFTKIIQESKEFVHLSNLYHHPYAEPFAEAIVKSLGCDKLECEGVGFCQKCPKESRGNLGPQSLVFFCNSGTEANEGAFKFARKVGKDLDPSGKKVDILSFGNAFHGRTMGALSATPSPKYQKPFFPLVPGFKKAAFNHTKEALESIDENTCAVIVEPVQGEGGIHVSSMEFLSSLRRKCDETGALLIFDEIQCGLGRTGKLYGYQNFGVTPDILTMAKPLANGIPIGAVVLSRKVASHIKPGDHGTTFGGSPFATKIGHEVFKLIQAPDFLKNVNAMGTYLKTRLIELQSPIVKDIRGLGLMIGIELKDGYQTSQFVDLARERGVLMISAGSNTIRLVPPLVITRKELDEALIVIQDVLKQMS